MKKLILMLCFILLYACSGDDTKEEVTQNADGILANIVTTNISSNSFPWRGVYSGILKRWNIEVDGLIPVKTNNVQMAIDAMDDIEEVLNKTIFDRTSISNLPNEEITRGLIVSEGTALDGTGTTTQNTCGHVSSGIGSVDYPNDFIHEGGVISTVLYVHLSSSGCTADKNIAIHEFGHALGMGLHFNGFGDGAAISKDFWNVLYNIYHNPVGATETTMVVTKVK